MCTSIEPGSQVVAILGEPAARKLLDVLTRSQQERPEVIGHLFAPNRWRPWSRQ